MEKFISSLFRNEIGMRWETIVFTHRQEHNLYTNCVSFFDGKHHFDQKRNEINNPAMIFDLIKKQMIFYSLGKKEIKKLATDKFLFREELLPGKLQWAINRLNQKKEVITNGIYGELILDLIMWLQGRESLFVRTRLADPGDASEIKGPDTIKISLTRENIVLVFGEAKFGSLKYVTGGLLEDFKKRVEDLKIYDYYKWIITSTDQFTELSKNKRLIAFMHELHSLAESYNLGVSRPSLKDIIFPVFKRHAVKILFSLVGVFEDKDLYREFSLDKINDIIQRYDEFLSKKIDNLFFDLPYEIEIHLLILSDDKSIRNKELLSR